MRNEDIPAIIAIIGEARITEDGFVCGYSSEPVTRDKRKYDRPTNRPADMRRAWAFVRGECKDIG